MAYHLYFPVMVAKSIVNETTTFVPEHVRTRIQKIRQPVNEGAQSVVETMHKSGVTMDQILKPSMTPRKNKPLPYWMI